MTTETKRLPVTTRMPSSTWRRFGLAFVLTLAALMVLAAVAAFAYARMNDGRILPGVSVAGVEVAGLTPQEATDKLRTSLPDVSAGSLTLRVGSVEERIGYGEIGRQYTLGESIDAAMSVGRQGNPLDQFGQQLDTMMGGVTITPEIEYDSRALADRVAAAVATAQVTPVNASITFKNGEYVVTPASDGQTVDGAEALRRAVAALDTASTDDTQVTVEAVAVPAEISTPDAQAAVQRAEAVTASPLYVTLGSETHTITSETLRGWVRLDETAPGEWMLVVERGPIDQLVARLKADIDQPAVDAEFRFEGGQPVAVPGQTGYELDAAAAGDSILAALNERGTGTATERVNVPLNTTVPAFTTEQAEDLVSRVRLLGEWTTKYVPSEANGNGQNIRRPTNLIDGYVVQPGEEFDFVDVAGPITRANGYGEGAAIVRGKTRGEGILGGGLCSASTTVYNAALRAGFQLGERRNHAYYISRYPVGLDATIWISGSYVQTVEFFNDSEYPIVIRGINRKRAVRYEIWGVPDGRTVNLSKPTISNEREAKNYYVFVDTLPARVQERKEYPADGFVSVVTRTVRDANGAIIHQDTIRSNYRRVDGIIWVGRAPGDPESGTKIPVSQGLPPVGFQPIPTPEPEPNPTDPPADTQPAAEFSRAVSGNAVTFTNRSTGTGLTFAWDFGDGTGSNRPNPTHEYAAPGTYQVTLTVTDGDGDSASVSKSVSIEGSAEQ